MNYLENKEEGETPQRLKLREVTRDLINLFGGADMGEKKGLRGDELIDYLLEGINVNDDSKDGKGMWQLSYYLNVELQIRFNTTTIYDSTTGEVKDFLSKQYANAYSAKKLAEDIAKFVSVHCDIDETMVVTVAMARAATFSKPNFEYLSNELEKVYYGLKRDSEDELDYKNNKYMNDSNDKPIIIIGSNNIVGNNNNKYIYPQKPESKTEAESKTTNEKTEESKEVTPKQQGYFDSDEFREGVMLAAEYIKTGKAKWSHVYFFLLEHDLPEMKKTTFGNFIHDHGGPSPKTVYSSGDYDNDKEKWIIERMSTFFPNIK